VRASRYRDLHARIATGSAVPPQRPGRASQDDADRLVG
jgi:hypothetical protein